MKRQSNLRLIPLILLILAPALLALWFVTVFERRPISVPVEPKVAEDRQLRPFKPLIAYLRASGHEVEILRGMRAYNTLPPAGSVLILRDFPEDTGGRLHERLYHWAEGGGRLIGAIMHHPAAAERRFFARLGARQLGTDADDDEDGATQTKQAGQDKQNRKKTGARPVQRPPKVPGEGPLYLHATLDGHPIRLDLLHCQPEWLVLPEGRAEWTLTGELQHRDPPEEKKDARQRRGSRRTKPEARQQAQQPAGSAQEQRKGERQLEQALAALNKADKKPAPRVPAEANLAQRHRVGAGNVTLITHVGMFLDDNLAKEDNAFLLTRMLAGAADGASDPVKVYLWVPDRGGAADSLIRRLVTGLPLTLMVTVLGLLLVLWNRQTRLHPPLPFSMPARRDILEYFTGAGRFAWRVNRARRLLAGNREALARFPARRGPAVLPEDGRALSAEERARAEDEALALQRPVHNEADLIQVSRAMCRLSRPARREAGRRGGRR